MSCAEEVELTAVVMFLAGYMARALADLVSRGMEALRRKLERSS